MLKMLLLSLLQSLKNFCCIAAFLVDIIAMQNFDKLQKTKFVQYSHHIFAMYIYAHPEKSTVECFLSRSLSASSKLDVFQNLVSSENDLTRMCSARRIFTRTHGLIFFLSPILAQMLLWNDSWNDTCQMTGGG